MVTSTLSPRFHAVVPAAGVGKRMGSGQPKQYLSLSGTPIIERTLNRLLAFEAFDNVVVAISPDDKLWSTLPLSSHAKIVTIEGGPERADSVLNALLHLASFCPDNDWVLVHDVARPCVELSDIARLIELLKDDVVGGILAVPASDTVKHVRQHTIHSTIDRNDVWLAQTPQMFRLGMLKSALQQGLSQGIKITDEASAIELQGQHPKVVEGSRSNIKITHPEDLALAELFCSQQLDS